MINFRTSPVYEKAYAHTRNLINGKAKVAAKQYSDYCKLGKTNPSQAKLLYRVATVDAFGDYALENCDTKLNAYKIIWKYIKNIIKANLFHSKEFKTEEKAIKSAYKELYPKTHKMRDKLLRQNKVKLENKFKPMILEFRKEAAEEIFSEGIKK